MNHGEYRKTWDEIIEISTSLSELRSYDNLWRGPETRLDINNLMEKLQPLAKKRMEFAVIRHDSGEVRNRYYVGTDVRYTYGERQYRRQIGYRVYYTDDKLLSLMKSKETKEKFISFLRKSRQDPMSNCLSLLYDLSPLNDLTISDNGYAIDLSTQYRIKHGDATFAFDGVEFYRFAAPEILTDILKTMKHFLNSAKLTLERNNEIKNKIELEMIPFVLADGVKNRHG